MTKFVRSIVMAMAIQLFSFGCGGSGVSSNALEIGGSAPQQPLPPPPDGWRSYRNPQEARIPDCITEAKVRWRITKAGPDYQIKAELSIHDQFDRDMPPFELEASEMGVTMIGRVHTTRVPDGWLVGLDSGEFGGGLWWFDDIGRERRKLLKENVLAVLGEGSSALCVTWRPYEFPEYANIVEVSSANDGEWDVVDLEKLQSRPSACTVGPDGFLYLYASPRLLRIRNGYRAETLWKADYGKYFPNSMVVSEDGSILIGMVSYVVRLTRRDGTYDEEWLAPIDCSRL